VLLLCATVLAEAGQQAPAATPRIHHTCGAQDRQFVEVARLNVETVDMFGDDYLNGSAKAGDVISAAQDGALAVSETSPVDPSLQTARSYLRSMFLAYARAVRARARHANPAPAMYRAYDLDEQVHVTLQPAQAKLASLGCDVNELL
jgi:hypothetical protein